VTGGAATAPGLLHGSGSWQGSSAPSEADLRRWRSADAAARPKRLAALRSRLDEDGLDAYFGVRPENARYLTGFVLGDGEEKVSGASGRFFVSADEAVVLADSRYRLQALEECPDSRVEDLPGDLVAAWPQVLAGLRAIASPDGHVRRIGIEAAHLSHSTWTAFAAATPDVELVPVENLVETLRAVKEPAELERVHAACAVADDALRATIADIRPGVTEHELALALEWRMRTGGAEGLAFDVACLSGPRAALPHGSPGRRTIRAGEVLLFDFGCRVDGYRSDMTRTLFVDEPTSRDLAVYELVAHAQAAAIELLEAELAAGRPITNRAVDAAAREVIEAAGHGSHFGHGTGHGIGLATHESPSLGRSSAEAPLPSPTIFSVEPGIYLDGETGVRIEDLVAIDTQAGSLRFLTSFPRGVTIVGT
jgi:Xaa-Pro aminopeptidase/Xaa-Pro dipeptidase